MASWGLGDRHSASFKEEQIKQEDILRKDLNYEKGFLTQVCWSENVLHQDSLLSSFLFHLDPTFFACPLKHVKQ